MRQAFEVCQGRSSTRLVVGHRWLASANHQNRVYWHAYSTLIQINHDCNSLTNGRQHSKMPTLLFTVSPTAVAQLHDALSCLAKFDETVAWEATADSVG